jgi:glutamate formiminotransferase
VQPRPPHSDTNTDSSQTKGLSLEEINERFGVEVVVYLTNATDKEREDIANTRQAEHDEKPRINETENTRVADRQI